MSKLSAILKYFKDNESQIQIDLINNDNLKNKNNRLEEMFEILLKKAGFVKKPIIPIIKSSKKDFLESTDMIQTPDEWNMTYIKQPFGSQSFPDFIVFENGRAFSIEIKNTQGSTMPKWNCGIPRPGYQIYLFRQSKLGITFFFGKDFITEQDALNLEKARIELKNAVDQINRTYFSEQKYGFCLYERIDVQQKRKYNEDAVLSYFTEPLRSEREKKVLSILRQR